jgi:hypothetical protein
MLRAQLLRALILAVLLAALAPGVGLADEAAPLAELPSCGVPLTTVCVPPVALPCAMPVVACPPAAPAAPSAAAPAEFGTPQPGYSPGGGPLVLARQMDPNPLWPAELCSPVWCYQWSIWGRPAVSPLAVGAAYVPAASWSPAPVCGCPWPSPR